MTDSLIDRKLATGLLSKHGHQVTFAGDGQQALRLCAEGLLDLVIVDFFLRDLNPGELIRIIRARAAELEKPCVILAVAADAIEVSSQYRELGMDGFLTKPMTMDQINAWMERCVPQPQVADSAGYDCHAIDWTNALEAVGGRRELLKDLIDIFFEEYPPTLSAIRDAIDQQNIKQLQLSAHKLKGCLRYFGNNRAAEKAQELEHLARGGTMNGAASRLEELETAMSTLLPMLKEAPL